MYAPSANIQSFYATCPKGLELLLAQELVTLGALNAREKLAGVAFQGELSLGLKACLWSRLANQILLPLAQFPAATADELYSGVQSIDWQEHMRATNTIAVQFATNQSQINHTLFGAQKVKDAIVDQFRENTGTRPNVSKDKPDIAVFVYVYKDQATVSLNLSGESLHKRGYRLQKGQAPLKENVAAAILLRAGYDKIAKEGGGLVDPMCGAGTILIEGAMLAADIAPGLLRDYFGFYAWRHFNAEAWQHLLAEAKERKAAGLKNLPKIVGYDEDRYAIKNAFANVESAGLLGKIHVEKASIDSLATVANATPGLVIANPPYGERLGEVEALKAVYQQLGKSLKEIFVGWRAAVLTSNVELGKSMGLRANKSYALFNGALACQLLLFTVQESFFVDQSPEAENRRRIRQAQQVCLKQTSNTLPSFINRVQKKLKHLRKHLKEMQAERYRIYDCDLPEYVFAIDIEAELAFVQEYAPTVQINEKKALQRRQEVLANLPELLNIQPAKIYYTLLPASAKSLK